MSYRKLLLQNTASGSATVSLPVHGTVELTQSYTPLQARTLFRKMSGAAVVRKTWSDKLATEITGSGLIPPGFAQIDWDTPVVISCVAHRSVTSSGAAVTIPAARRTDVQHVTKAGTTVTGSWYARAWDGDTYAVATGATTTGAPNVVTITLATGESHEHYEVVYLPKLTCYCEPPEERFTQNQGWSWTLRAEEV